MTDTTKLIDSLRYGFPYYGDRDRDCADALENLVDRNIIKEEKDRLIEIDFPD